MRSAGPYYPALTGLAVQTTSSGMPIVLIAHSGAGALVPLVAERLGGNVGAIFVDALLPYPGRSWFDTAPDALKQRLNGLAVDGRLPPWPSWWPRGAIAKMLGDPALAESFEAECAALPIAYFNEIAPISRAMEPLHCGDLQLSGGYAEEVATATADGWPVRTLALNHLAMLTHADAVIAVLDELIASIDIR
jgi:hypothetical protein